MTVSEFKTHLQSVDQLIFQQPNGQVVPLHFHITEMGLTTKHFVDCGGTTRTEAHASLQIWVAEDYDHRLSPDKLIGIIDMATPLLQEQNPELEIEYQTDTIGRYALDFKQGKFVLMPKQTDCLAKETCMPEIASLPLFAANNCAPGSGCC
ncbi:MAG: DUF6428 family protein [Phaeodactylibacter sp.]|uniref:DUF6428 family protein n=1 Tax=Phaeodactylibacter sp. TaxID=1940289 RepID=UPI0032EB93DF